MHPNVRLVHPALVQTRLRGRLLPRRSGAFATLKPGTAWHDPVSGLLLTFESLGACGGAPGLPLYNHSARAFIGFRGEFPFQEAYEQADYTGLQTLECAHLVVTTAAPVPQGRLEVEVEAVTAPTAAATPGTASSSSSRRRLHVLPTDDAAGQFAGGDSGSGSGSALSGAGIHEGCAVAATPTLRLRLPAGQQLSSVIWRDGLNRTIHVDSAASLAAAMSSEADWTTAAVTLPLPEPLQESSADPAAACSAAACDQLQRSVSVALVAADGRHSRADITLAPATLAGQEMAVRVKYYERTRLTYKHTTSRLPLAWPAGGGGSANASAIVGVALYDGSRSQPLQLSRSGGAAIVGTACPAAHAAGSGVSAAPTCQPCGGGGGGGGGGSP